MATLSANSLAARLLLDQKNCILVNRQGKTHIRRYKRDLKCKNALSPIKGAFRAHYSTEITYKPLFRESIMK